VSLESSERIRKQQKELINLLQRSHSIGAVASDTGSILSFNSISSIGEAPANTSSRRAADLSSASLAAENREWYDTFASTNSQLQHFSPHSATYFSFHRLNRSMNFPSASQVPPPHTRELAAASHSSRRRSSVSAGMTQSDALIHSGHGSSRPSSAGQDGSSSARTGTTPRSVSQSSTSSAAGRAKRTSNTAGTKVRRRKSTADIPKAAEHQYSASFHDSAASYSDIVSMNSSLVPNRHGEAVDTSVHRSGANLSAYGIENVSNYQIPVRQGLDSFNTSIRGVSLNQTSSSYVPGSYVPGLGTPTLAAHMSHQQGQPQDQDASRLGRPPRHPAMMSPALVPTGRAATPVHHVPSVSKETMHSFSTDPRYAAMVAEQATPTASKTVKRTSSTKTKGKKTTISASPSAAPSAFVRRIPSASPARAAVKSPYSVDNKVHTQPHQQQQTLHKPKQHVSSSRYASPEGRPASAPAGTHLSTFGVSKRIL